MTDELKCPRCGGAMEEGFLPEYSRNGICETLWVAGQPEASAWTGLKTRDKRRYKTVTYRCGSCGRLESFAREQVE
ncbi:MAG: PF20097 family protein [Acidobacteriota bacterium]|nr:PF20097 family protein [Acidobacteriota bacterium]